MLCCAVLCCGCCPSTQWHAGDNVGTGKDYTLFSTVDGIVIYSKKQDRSLVSAAAEAPRVCVLSGGWRVETGIAHEALPRVF